MLTKAHTGMSSFILHFLHRMISPENMKKVKKFNQHPQFKYNLDNLNLNTIKLQFYYAICTSVIFFPIYVSANKYFAIFFKYFKVIFGLNPIHVTSEQTKS